MTPEQLRAWRTAHGWNQTQAARYLRTTQVNISRWEQGLHEIPGAVELLLYLYQQPRNLRAIETFLYKSVDK